MLTPCLIDHDGAAVSEWLPDMQSGEFLRSAIARGERTAECWTELARRQERLRAALAALSPLHDPDTLEVYP